LTQGRTVKDIGAKLWQLCHTLRGDGGSYLEYITELTYLLFLKMAQETGMERSIPEDCRWSGLTAKVGMDQLTHYRALLLKLSETKRGLLADIFAEAQTKLRKPTSLKMLTEAIDRLDWFSAREEGLGNLYEELLERTASEKKGGAGQYFTPRPLIDCIVRLVKPQPSEVIQDPAAGTGGFLVACDHYIKEQTDDLYSLSEDDRTFQRKEAFTGLELVHDTHRLCLMNLMLHGIEGRVRMGDTLSSDGEGLSRANLIVTNPPFGTKRGGERPNRAGFVETRGSSNKQLAFVEHIYRNLAPGGRAAVVVPDNVLFEDNTGRAIRQQLMAMCDLHTILRLPTGIFYAGGVKTNVLFFTRGRSNQGNTREVWIYDMRTGQAPFGKTRPLTREDFAAFEAAFGDDPLGRAPRQDQGEEGRFRCFSRAAIADRQDNLDIVWLRGAEDAGEDSLEDPADIAAAMVEHLRRALTRAEALAEELAPLEAV
jgi:type I restriction enzyme M protein